MSESSTAVITQENIASGTLLGPLPLSSGSPDSLALLTWKCVDKIPPTRQIIKIIPRDQGRGSPRIQAWLVHIQPSRNPEEQNLEVVAKSGQLYYRSLRDISVGEELRAWFGQDLADLLRLPLLPSKISEGGKHFECMFCQEQFENPFPVVAHLMYRCRRRDALSMGDPVKRKNGGRVKNFDIATLTDMELEDSNKKDENHERLSPSVVCRSSGLSSSINNQDDPIYTLREENTHSTSKKKTETDGSAVTATKRPRMNSTQDLKSSQDTSIFKKDSKKSSTSGAPSSAFKMTNSSTINNSNTSFSNLEVSGINSSADCGSSSAFKKVDKSNVTELTSFHTISSMSSIFGGTMSRRDILLPSAGHTFSPFPYTLPSVTSSSPGGASVPAGMVTTVPHPILTTSTDLSSAFIPTKLSNAMSDASNAHIKLNEELKLLPGSGIDNGFDSRTLIPQSINSARLSGLPGLPYVKPIQSPIDGFGSKSFATPLLSFLPPSLAALTFPTQNWCAKCNASFRMTSDLVYHMRSHHKRDADPQKVKREEKLRCHICHESFRERHHLTRHMTSHQ